MSIKLTISPVFKKYTDNKVAVLLDGSTLGEVLADLIRQYPDTRNVFFDKNGNLRNGFDVFVNGKSVFPKTMDMPVNEEDTLNLVMMIHGG